MLLRGAIDGFLLALEARGCAPRTVGSYRERLAGFAVWGDRQVEDVKPAELDLYVVSLRRQNERYLEHPTRSTVAGGLSAATVAGRVQSVKAFFNWCVERGLVDVSPARHLRRPRVEQGRGGKVMAVEDLARLVVAAEERAADGRPRDLALLLFLVETGCRVGELVSLRVEWLDLERCEARCDGKRGRRTLDFTERSRDALAAYLGGRLSGPVWMGQRGPLSERGVYEVLRSLAREAEVEGRFNPHSIRHLVGQSWADQVNLELVRLKLGHEDIHTTAMFYANQDRERVRAATRRLSLVNHGRPETQ